ncbi:hypothetical protein BDFB_015027, partial [Asbolus verrucosus]
RDLDNIATWCEEWMLPLNVKKCNSLYIGPNNPVYLYHINRDVIVKLNSCLDLGVVMTSDLSWSAHISRIVKKANILTFLIKFANSVWTPVLQRDKDLLEALQRWVTRIPYGRIRPQYAERLR